MAPPTSEFGTRPARGTKGEIPTGIGLGTAISAAVTIISGLLLQGEKVRPEPSGDVVEDAAAGCGAALFTVFLSMMSAVLAFLGVGLSGLAVLFCALAIARGYRRHRFVYLNAAVICACLALIGLGVYVLEGLKDL